MFDKTFLSSALFVSVEALVVLVAVLIAGRVVVVYCSINKTTTDYHSTTQTTTDYHSRDTASYSYGDY